MVLGTGAIAAVSVGLNKKSQDKGIKNRAYGLMVDPSKKIGKLAKLTKELEKTKRPLRKVKEDSSLEKNPEKLKKEELRSVPTIEAEIQKEKETIEVSNPDKNAGAWKRLMNYLGIGRSDDYKEYRTQKLAKENLARNFIELSDMEKKYGISPEDQAKNNKLKQMAKDKKGGYERARKRLNTFNEQGFKRLSKSDMTFLEKKKALRTCRQIN
jgi:deoxyribodipyrimidine photolyase